MSDEPNPWSSDQPVTPPPIEFVFTEPQPSADSVPVEIDTAARRRWINAGVGVCVVVAGLAAASTLGSGDDSSAASDVSLAPVNTTDTDEPADAGRASTPPATTPPATAPSTTTDRVTTSGSVLPDAPLVWVDGRIAVPDRLSGFGDPTQVVLVTGRGRVMEIDLRDGATSTLELGERRPNVQLHVRSDVALLTSNGSGRRPILVEHDEQPIEIDIGGGSGGYYFSDNDSNIEEFRVTTFDGVSGVSTTRSLSTDGVLSDVEQPDEYQFGGSYEVTTGERLAYSAGDLFLVSPPGQQPTTSRRLSTGLLIGRSPGVVFVSECDEQRNCARVLIDIETEARTPVPDFEGVQFFGNLQLASMSPDGTAMLIEPVQDSPLFVELTTGDAAQLPFRLTSNNGQAISSWALDSSGIFTVNDTDLTFVDRLTGEATVLPIDFGDTDNIIDVAVRRVPGS